MGQLWGRKQCECPPCNCTCGMLKKNYYTYYDSPEGCHIDKKMAVVARYGAIAGMIIGGYDILMYSHSTKLAHMLRRIAYHTIPLTMMGATFAFVANVATQVRDEDDELNYFLGGAAASPFLALYLNSGYAIFPGSLLLGAAAAIKKMSVDANIPLIPEIKPYAGNVWRHKSDYSLLADPLYEKKECGDCDCDEKADKKRKRH